MNPELSKISSITKNIYLSGIFPLDEDVNLVKQFNIKYIVCCLDRNYIADVHDKLMTSNPQLTILYLPYIDDVKQNLWKRNNSNIQISKFSNSIEDYNSLRRNMEIYEDRPFIEIGYHFINNALESDDGGVLIHCMAGISRSVSILTYYLMKKYNLDYDTAILMVKKNRSIANPNDSFKQQLKNYHQKRERFTSSDADNIIKSLNLR
jgi:hypothetical protein